MRILVKSIILLVINFLNDSESSPFLEVCSNNGFIEQPYWNEKLNFQGNNQNEKIHRDWFKWGSLYSFCMQVNLLFIFFSFTLSLYPSVLFTAEKTLSYELSLFPVTQEI